MDPERIIPDETEPGIVATHLARYAFARPRLTGLKVLDAGCGVGYGTHFLAVEAAHVTGIDVSDETIAYACRRYGGPRTEFRVGDLHALDFPNASFDAVCSFETIEHVDDPERVLAELARVLRPTGTLFLSTPNAPTTTRTPANPFHRVEWSAQDFERLLRSRFAAVELFGQRRAQTGAHRLAQRLDVLGLRRRFAFLRRGARLLGTAPTEELTLDDVLVSPGVAGASEIVAICHFTARVMRVAVVIPTRDRGELLATAVASALAADAVDEIVIVDAGSTDGSVEAAGRLGDIRVVELDAANAAKARNAGVAVTDADALAFLDSDDVMQPGKSRSLAAALGNDAGLALVHGQTTVVDADGVEDRPATREHERQRAEAARVGTTYEALAAYCAMYTSATLVRRSAFDAVAGYDESLDVFEDWDLYLRLALVGRLAYVPEPAALYRVWPGNVSWERTAAGIVRVAEKHLATPPPLSASALAEARYGFLRRLAAANHVLVRPAETRRAALAALRRRRGGRSATPTSAARSCARSFRGGCCDAGDRPHDDPSSLPAHRGRHRRGPARGGACGHSSRRGGPRGGPPVPAEGPASDRFLALGADVAHVSLGSLRRPHGVPTAARILRDYDVIYSHTSVPGAILGGGAARLARRPHVVHQHALPYLSDHRLVRRGQAWLYAAALRRATVVAVAEHIRDELVGLGVSAPRIAVVANGVPEVRAPGPRPGPPVVGMLARLDPGKNVHVFLEAAALLDADVRKVAGVSRGPFLAYEREVRAAAPGARVELIEPEDGVAFLAGLDVVVIPSASEGSPLTLLEAMALGRAVVASDIPGIREVLAPDGAGVLVPPGDPAALAAAVSELLADDARRAELGRRASNVVAARYGLAAMTARMVRLLVETAHG